MNKCFGRFFTLIVCLAIVAGCQGDPENGSDDRNKAEKKDSGKEKMHAENGEGHPHAEGHDKLVWSKKDLDVEGYKISLGHHGDHFHFGDKIEPAVIITKDGNDVADAEIFNSMITKEDQSVLVEEVKLVFEPKTDAEPAHYAQGEMTIPKGKGDVMIRFRIKLPGSENDSVHDIEFPVH